MNEARLSPEALAAATGSDPSRIEELVAAGILAPSDGSFESGDVQRVLVAEALVEAGLPLALLASGIEAGIVSFAETDILYPDPGPLGPSVLDLARELDLEPETLLRVITAFGLPQPDPDAPLHQPDADHLRTFVAAWRPLGDDELLVRAARLYGEALDRAAGWMDLFADAVLVPLAGRSLPWDQMREAAFEPGRAVVEAGRRLLPWLYDRHLFGSLNQSNFDSIEQQLALLGLASPPADRSAAIVFADLTGFTRLTEEHGDHAAADIATRLALTADEVARRRGGRLVKLLGDGVMLHFERPADALPAALELRAAMEPVGLPAAHIGIAAGAIVRRESDFFGRVVNRAARLAGAAGPGEILVSEEMATSEVIGADGPRLVRLAPLSLKGIPHEVVPYRLEA